MKYLLITLRILLLAAIVALPTGAAYAQSPGGDIVRFGENYTLEKGQTQNGDVAVFGGNIAIEEEARVNGSLVLFGGNLNIAKSAEINGDMAVFGGNIIIDGKVDGDLVIFGGQIHLTGTAVVDGNIATIGGQIQQDEGAQVTGDITKEQPFVNVPQKPGEPKVEVSVNPFTSALASFFRAVVVALVGMLLMLFLQPQFERVSDAITSQPLMAGGFGLLTLIIAPLAIVIMIITIILIPIAIIAAMLIPLAWLFGIIALGMEVGMRFTKAINQTWSPVLTTGFGTFILMLIAGLVGLIPCVGWLFPFLFAMLGIGATAMTWFGTRSAARPALPPAESAPSA